MGYPCRLFSRHGIPNAGNGGSPTDKPLFTLTGLAVRGKRLGTRLGFPTANIAYEAAGQALPQDGVYIALARLEGTDTPYLSILNQGKHPTAPQGRPTVEAHLLDYSGGELYGRQITLSYQRFLRPEQKFPSLDALREQLARDRAAAQAWALENPFPTNPEGESMSEAYQNPLEILQASYGYDPEGPLAVDHVSMSVPKGSFVAVLGHNGSGKSTLSKLMNALFLPTQGQVLVCGMDTAEDSLVWEIRKRAGMVFQNPDNQIVATVVREDVAFGLENMGVPQPEMIPRIDAALQAVRMADFAAAAPHMLSGGQKQRVAVAGVLAMEPEVMILDEATAMLDPTGRAEVLATVRKLNRDKGITVVWITHFMEEAAQADRVVVLSHGAIALDGTPGQVFSQVEEIKALGLDVPPMAELAGELRRAGMALSGEILTVPDMVKELKQTLCPSK
ncbi:MAG: energy-coupling factor transporter ATPase [Candidatus Limiplasma sp.]|nr:energy-coupling factor transporter ATPase [Candidatus Limiplasma sp.]